MLQQLAKGLQAARGSPDADDGKAVLALCFEQRRFGSSFHARFARLAKVKRGWQCSRVCPLRFGRFFAGSARVRNLLAILQFHLPMSCAGKKEVAVRYREIQNLPRDNMQPSARGGN